MATQKQTKIPVDAYVDANHDLMVRVHPMYPAERARKATGDEVRLSALTGPEGWFATLVSARTMARLESSVRDEEGY